MKSEKDFEDGAPIHYSNYNKSHNFTGVVDYSDGREAEGYIRVRRVHAKSLNKSHIQYVPADSIYTGE